MQNLQYSSKLYVINSLHTFISNVKIEFCARIYTDVSIRLRYLTLKQRVKEFQQLILILRKDSSKMNIKCSDTRIILNNSNRNYL